MRKVGDVYIAESAVVEGDVELGTDTNVWHHCTIRGDVAPVRVGQRVNIQENSILHVDYDVPLMIADEVLIGHCGVIHCSSIGRGTMIGIGARVLDHCEIGEDCIIAAGAIVTPDTVIPDGSVVMGIPGKVVRQIRDEEREYISARFAMKNVNTFTVCLIPMLNWQKNTLMANIYHTQKKPLKRRVIELLT
jgi:carbonic anhydrase/acetyltransferase-like protein (isoleucine patch superfamily)